jgi:hypothetical protein
MTEDFESRKFPDWQDSLFSTGYGNSLGKVFSGWGGAFGVLGGFDCYIDFSGCPIHQPTGSREAFMAQIFDRSSNALAQIFDG